MDLPPVEIVYEIEAYTAARKAIAAYLKTLSREGIDRYIEIGRASCRERV